MMRIGGYTLHAIETGRFRLDGGAMFGIIPKPLWERRIAADERNRIPLSMRCLLLEGDGRLILIDAGVGHKYDDKFADIYGIDHGEVTLEASLRGFGYDLPDVTDVVLTHLHFDHCGGCTRAGEGRAEVAFPNARIHVQRRQWESASAPNVRERGSFLPENVNPLIESGQLQLADGELELFPRLHLHVVEGHTEAQQLVRIEGKGEQLLYVADLLPTHAHLASAWNMAYDLLPLVTITEKMQLLDRAFAENWSLFFEHDPEVEVASLHSTEKGYRTTDHRPLAE